MAGLLDALPVIGSILSIGGTLLGMEAQREQGKAAEQQAAISAEAIKKAAEFGAVQHEYIAGQAKAVSQREALEQRKAAQLLASRALAVAAASGAGAADPTVTKIISDIVGEGAYRAALALYQGEEEAKTNLMSAQSLRETGLSSAASRLAEGESIARASRLSMFSTLLSGTASWADKYGSRVFGGGSQVFDSGSPAMEF